MTRHILVANVDKAQQIPKNWNWKMAKKKEANRIFASFWKILIHRIYILSWIRDYDGEKAIADLIAGFTLGLTLIPQGIAYASLANLPSQVKFWLDFWSLWTGLVEIEQVIFFNCVMHILMLFQTRKKELVDLQQVPLPRISCASLTRLVGQQQVNFADHKQD